jgi:hypothetical protein
MPLHYVFDLKWKHLKKKVLPGEESLISYCALGSALAGKSEVTALV